MGHLRKTRGIINVMPFAKCSYPEQASSQRHDTFVGIFHSGIMKSQCWNTRGRPSCFALYPHSTHFCTSDFSGLSDLGSEHMSTGSCALNGHAPAFKRQWLLSTIFCVLSTERIHSFRMILRIISDYFLNHQLPKINNVEKLYPQYE
jgi:hypothetical protein